MKTTIYKVLSLTAFIFFISNSFAFGQTPEIEQAQARVNKITGDAGIAFKQGLLNLKDNRRSQAGNDFNKSVEVFLLSSINLTSKDNTKARDCYSQLIETIYRIEFPSDAQLPQIRSLSATCGWNIENALADDVAKIVRPSNQPKPTAETALVASAAANGSAPNIEAQIGFNDQKFEVSPLDELAKLELTPEEQQVESDPVAQQQLQYAMVAVAN